MKEYIEIRLYNNGKIERIAVDEKCAYGWIDNPGYSSNGYYFVIDTSDKIDRKFKKFLSKHIKEIKAEYEENKKAYDNLKMLLSSLQ